VSAILGGAVFGDHCSPISDTTILSSMASSCDHVDHVRTQLPYALLGAGLAVFVGYLPEAFAGISPWLLLVVGFVAIAFWVRTVARPV
jgi:Na+/H+ antiporter NhaC